MKQFLFIISWYGATVCALIFASFMLIYLSFDRVNDMPKGPRYQMYKALPTDNPAAQKQEIGINSGDGRATIITEFFEIKKSPLAGLASEFVDVADKYSLDYRLLPAIAMQESNGAKKMPKDSNNPFGYGIYGGKVIKFSSFEEAIERVGKGLKNDYIDQGLKTPEQIMAKYTPPSLQKEGAWAIGVSAFMEQLL